MSYIERKKLLERFEVLKENADTLRDKIYLDGVLATIDSFPTADVVEVRHGKWIKKYSDNKLDGNYYCSNCKNGIDIATGEETPIDRELYYCPCCGAKMDGENE